MSKEEEFAQKLRENRAAGMSRRAAIKKIVAPDMSLSRYVQVEDFIFVGMALAMAMLKDILDFTGIGSLPAIGTVITFMVTGFIWAAMFLAGANGMKKNSQFFKRVVAYGGGVGAEFLLGLNFLPIETCMVIYLYYLLLKERAEHAQEEYLANAQYA